MMEAGNERLEVRILDLIYGVSRHVVARLGQERFLAWSFEGHKDQPRSQNST
jgi:hypothetical protein